MTGQNLERSPLEKNIQEEKQDTTFYEPDVLAVSVSVYSALTWTASKWEEEEPQLSVILKQISIYSNSQPDLNYCKIRSQSKFNQKYILNQTITKGNSQPNFNQKSFSTKRQPKEIIN